MALFAIYAAIGFDAVTGAHASNLAAECPAAAGHSAAPESAPSAQADAAAMLAELPLPAGSQKSSTDPQEAGSLLAGPATGTASPNGVDEHAWWLVPAAPAEALVYICKHLPPGSGRSEYGTGPSGSNIPENTFAGFTWPGGPGTLVVWAVRLPSGSSALRADAEVVWIVPRAASERIPGGVRRLAISAHTSARTRIGTERAAALRRLPSRVTSVARIAKIITMLNGLRVRQPGVSNCTLAPTGSVRLAFSANSKASPLAVATINTAGCGGVGLTIHGVAEPELEGGWYLVEQITHALGIRDSRHR
jgi:hypothetical protein